MNYTLEHASLLARQLAALATRDAHQLAGQVANLEFWLGEARHVLATIDGYPARFRRLRDGQQAWVARHETRDRRPCPYCGGKPCELAGTPPPPTRTSSDDLEAARRAVRQGCYRLLLRLHSLALLDEPALEAACDSVGVTLEREDLDDAP
jgi:hypothetical protein